MLNAEWIKSRLELLVFPAARASETKLWSQEMASTSNLDLMVKRWMKQGLDAEVAPSTNVSNSAGTKWIRSRLELLVFHAARASETRLWPQEMAQPLFSI